MGEGFNWAGVLHAGDTVVDRLIREGLWEKAAWAEPDSHWASESLVHLGWETGRRIPWIWKGFYLRLIFLIRKRESIADPSNTHTDEQEQASDSGKHKIMSNPKVLKDWKMFVLLWFQLKDRNVQMAILSLKRDNFVEKKNGSVIGMHGVIEIIYICLYISLNMNSACVYVFWNW